MKKAVLFFLALAVLIGFVVKDSEAGQLCWAIDSGTQGYIKVSSTSPDPAYPHKLLNGTWYSPSTWLLPVVGTMESNSGGTTKRVSLHGTYVSGSDLYDYVLDATIDPVTKNGTIYIFSDLLGSTNSFTLTKISCATAPAP